MIHQEGATSGVAPTYVESHRDRPIEYTPYEIAKNALIAGGTAAVFTFVNVGAWALGPEVGIPVTLATLAYGAGSSLDGRNRQMWEFQRRSLTIQEGVGYVIADMTGFSTVSDVRTGRDFMSGALLSSSDRWNRGISFAAGVAGGIGSYRFSAGFFARGRGFDRLIAQAVVLDDYYQLRYSTGRNGLVSQIGRQLLKSRDLEIYYRGQNSPLAPGEDFLSYLAREGQGGAVASRAYLRDNVPATVSSQEIANASAVWHHQELPTALFGPELGGTRAGGVGIPFSSRLKTTLDTSFTGSPNAIIYAVLVRRGRLHKPVGWGGLRGEQEYTKFHRLYRHRIFATLNPHVLR